MIFVGNVPHVLIVTGSCLTSAASSDSVVELTLRKDEALLQPSMSHHVILQLRITTMKVFASLYHCHSFMLWKVRTTNQVSAHVISTLYTADMMLLFFPS